MSGVRESDIRKALKARVESYGGEVRAVSWLGRRNAPDVLCGFPQTFYLSFFGDQEQQTAVTPHHVFIETKRPGKTASAAQKREHERMRSWGCRVLTVTTIEELDAWLPPLK